MQFMQKKAANKNLEELRDITQDIQEADFVPYACHFDPHSVVTKNGELLQIIKITGFSHEKIGSGEADVNLRAKIREAVMKCVDSTKYAVWIHTIRRKKNLKTQGEYKSDFSGYLNNFWNDKNDWEHKFVNEVYVTVVHEGKDAKMANPSVAVLSAVPWLNKAEFDNYLEKSCRELTAVTEKMVPILDSYGAKRLSVSQRDNRYYSEVCEFLEKLLTLREVEFPMGPVDLSRALTNYDVTFGYNAMEVRMRSDQQRKFGAILTLREYRELPVQSLDLILQVPSEFIISQSFEFIPAKMATQQYEEQKELLTVSSASGLYDKIGLKGILESDKGNKTDYGQHQLNIFLLADSVKTLEVSVANMVKAFSTLGMMPIREDVVAEECYWAQLPGNFEFLRRMRPINTARIGGFANLSNFPAGQETGNHWGPAVTTFHTAARTPYFFNFHKGNNGHTAILGQVGAGKTVLMNFLLSEARKFDNKIFLFDVNRGSEIFLRSINGEYYNAFPGADAREYAGIKLNPFSLDDTPQNRAFLSYWMTSLVENSEDKNLFAACEKAVAEVMALPKEHHNLMRCLDAMRNMAPDIASAFTPWTQGKLRDVFSEQDTLLLDKKVYGFEMGDVLRSGIAAIPIILYLLHRVESVLDGTPAIIVLAEAWNMLDNKFFAPQLTHMMDDLRAKNTMVIFATDYVDEIFASGINRSLMKEIATQIYMPDGNADDAYRKAFGLTQGEIAYLSVMNIDDRHFLIKRGNDTIVGELNLSGMADIMSILSSSPAHLLIMEEAISKNGLAYKAWLPSFLEMIK